MPKFTITTEAGDGPETPNEPIEFPDVKAATDDVQVALGEMTRDKLPNVAKDLGEFAAGDQLKIGDRHQGEAFGVPPKPS